MTPIKPVCMPPATKNADCLAVVGVLPGVCASHVLALAYKELRKNHPFLIMRLELALQLAAVPRGPACGDTAPAAGAVFSADPHGNHGDSKTQTTAGGVL